MSLRTKLLYSFGLLAVLPLLLMGLFHYAGSMRTVERHLVAQVEQIAERAADELTRRHEIHVSDLRLLAENAETQWLFRALARGTARSAEVEAARRSAEGYVETVWSRMSPYYRAVELRDASGAVVLAPGPRVPDWTTLPGERVAASWSSDGRALGRPVLEQPIRDEVSGVRLGTVVAVPRLTELLPIEALETRFGSRGYSLVVDRATGRLVHDSRPASPPVGAAGSPAGSGAGQVTEPGTGGGSGGAPPGFDLTSAQFSASRGEFRFSQGGATGVAAFVSLDDPPWTVVSVATLEEFSAPFERMRALNLAVVLLVLGAVAVASLLVVRRATRSLEELTAAAGDVARGEFLPSLPPPGHDEVGRLAGAFSTMVDRIREMMAQLQASRQMAAVGEFAAELAHEIRNPLTSVKLNLQRIDRAVAAEGGPAEAAAPLSIALREVARLERVVRGVLDLGRPRPLERESVSLNGVAAAAVDAIRPEAEAGGVRVVMALTTADDRVLADADQLRGALLNLLLNGIEAMPGGGELFVSTAPEPEAGPPVLPPHPPRLARQTLPPYEPHLLRPPLPPNALHSPHGGGAPTHTGGIVLMVRDSGPGVPAAVRERLFRPFFTTKPGGTGLGLAVALRTVEEHGGRLDLVNGSDAGPGATFRLVLPVVGRPVQAGAAL
jgi:signal transduction histidine kinase